MRGTDRLGIWLTTLVALLPAAVHADATHACAAITNDGERLACYDTAFGRPTGYGGTAGPRRGARGRNGRAAAAGDQRRCQQAR